MQSSNSSLVAEFLLLGLSDNTGMQVVLFGLFTWIYLVTIMGNLVIITLIRSQPTLHKPMYFFLENLSFLDFLVTSATVPKMLDNLLKKTKSISFAGCISQIYLFQIFIVAECFLLAVMAYDRYVAICQPLRYADLMKRTTQFLLVIFCWVMGFINSVIETISVSRLVFCGPNTIHNFFCDPPPLFKLSCSDTSTQELILFSVGFFVGLLPALIVVFSYIPIIFAIVRISSAQGRYKTFSTCASHLLVVSIFYGTGIFTYVIQPRLSNLSQVSSVVTVLYTVIAPMLNPFIYSLRNQDVHHAFKNLICKTFGKTI